MKNPIFRSYSAMFLFLISSAILTCCSDDYSGAVHEHLQTKKKLLKVLKEFAVSEEEKDAEAHRNLFLSSSSSVNFVLKNNGNPNLATLSRDQWIGFFTSWDYEYFPKYSDVKFYINDGIALDSHLFQGVRDGVDDLYGNDLFLYARTTSGWKIVSLASTIVTPDDITDYDTIPGIDQASDQLLLDFESSFNQRNESVFNTLFISQSTPCFKIDSVFDEVYTDEIHSANGFFANSPSGSKIKFTNSRSKVKDQFTAILSSSFDIIDSEEKTIQKGELLSIVAGTTGIGWKIAGMVFSVE